MTFQMALTFAVFLFICVTLSWKKIPTELGCIGAITILWLFGVLDTDGAWGNFVGNTVLSLGGMLIVGAALKKTSIIGKLADLLMKMKGGERVMVAAAIIFPFLMCQFVAATPALVICLPLLSELAERGKVSKSRLILPAALGAQLGIGFFPIGMSTVLFLQKNEFLANLGSTETMQLMDICLSRIPAALAAMIYVILIGYKLLPAKDENIHIESDARMQDQLTSKLPKWKEYMVYIIFVGTIVAIFFADNLNLSAGQIAITAAILLVVLGVLDGGEAANTLLHSPVIMVGCMLSMATAMTNSGLADIIADKLGAVIGSASSTAFVIGAFFLVCAILTQFMENGSLVNILTPLAILACMECGVSSLPVICAIELSSITAIMTPMASATAATAFGAGNYSIKQGLIFGLPVVAIEMIVTIIWMPLYFGV